MTFRKGIVNMNGLIEDGKTHPEVLFDNRIWFNSTEAAIFLKKTENAIRIAVCRGSLRSYKWRRRLYFKKSDLDKILNSSINFGGF
jgi:hypothetical protein